MSHSVNLKQDEPQWLQIVENQVNSTRFGLVQIVVHDSRVVQIERTVKVRLDRPDEKGLSALSREASSSSPSDHTSAQEATVSAHDRGYHRH